MQEAIQLALEDAGRAIDFMKREESVRFIEQAATLITDCYRNEGKVLIAGNGGSLCDAMHFAEELTGVFRKKRKALPAIALADSGHLTCVSNDLGFDEAFARYVEALGQKGDCFIALTTSGNSENLMRAQAVAKEKQLKTISFLGKQGGRLKGLSDLEWCVPGYGFSDRIQEAHMCAMHIIIELIEKKLFTTTTSSACLSKPSLNKSS